RENLDFYADIYSVPRQGREETVRRLLEFSQLTPFRKRLAGNLSGGMKQKLGLACALVHTPKVLFLDEPTNGVDPVSRRDFWRILDQLLREKVTLFVSTAYLDEAERCHRIGLIHKGELLACGPPAEVKSLMRGAIVEVRAAPSRRAVTRLREDPDTAASSLFGDRIHVVTDRPEEISRRIEERLSEAGVTVHSVRVIEPDLEDVFVSVLTQSREATADERSSE
nr:ABC transporter ATP-binding protein [Gemmatimonadota bacterium]NIU53183.1 ATP-binding cassette domain-containing protein [Gemmatimonadota bacterium]NIW77526.1 ATP-binding cassette domain-containing protein [Gemmatimonadota bacterium]NIY37391.1 ATP-binding cassette domain-containing protein [Gemmatimonadota bacterium]NIY43776.1 ATP-binding cassette domain-containing protein [Gemmatimonadota bacterium]